MTDEFLFEIDLKNLYLIRVFKQDSIFLDVFSMQLTFLFLRFLGMTILLTSHRSQQKRK